MMGKPKQTEPKLFYHGLSLEQRIPKDDPLRQIKKLVDFTFIRSHVADLYGQNGNPSVDPVVILKLMFLLFYENIKSERALMRKLPLRMDWLWFCDYDLDEETPDHSVLSKARRRWGSQVFETFFMNILEQCIAAGLVDGETIYIDSSTINANADIDKARPQLRKISQEIVERLDELDEDGDIPQTLEKRVNPVDPDARIGKKYNESTLGYKDHRVVDDQQGIITSTITTPANTRDDKVLEKAITTHQFKTKTKVKTAVADKIYGTGANYKYLYEAGTTCCIPHQRYVNKYAGQLCSDVFGYDRKQNCYICPAGQKLQLYDRKGPSPYRYRYRCERQICEQCGYFEHCVTSKKFGRQVERNINAAYVEWADQCLPKHERKRLKARRQSKMEGSFANAANNYGFKRARWRGLAKMQIQNLMIAAIQNLGKLMRYGVWGRETQAALTAIKDVLNDIEVILHRLGNIFAMNERI
jgi:transposase